MIKRENVFGIKCLLMYPAVSIVDPTTLANIQLKTAVEFFPDEFLPDFLEAQNSIRQKMEKQKMPVEKAADTLIDFFNEYEPKALKIKVDVINNNSFFPVSVIAESGFVSSIEADEKREESKKKPAKEKPKKPSEKDNDKEETEEKDDE